MWNRKNFKNKVSFDSSTGKKCLKCAAKARRLPESDVEYKKICEICGKERIFKNKNSFICSKATKCGSCTKKGKFGSQNSFYGKKHSEESRKKMSGPRPQIKGENNPYKKSLQNPEKLLAAIKRQKDFWESKDDNYRKMMGSKLSISMARSTKFIHGYKNHKHGHYLAKNGKTFFYRSSWEKTTLEYLDLLYEEEKVVDFDLEPFCIDYFDEGFKYSLRIDFQIKLFNNEILILECKPIGLRNYGRNQIKINAYQEYCEKNGYRFILFGEKEINSLESFFGMQLSDLSTEELKVLRNYLKSKRLKNIIEKDDPFDLKFAMHLVRLAYEAEQILVHHDLDLRKNSEHLKAIRRGDIKEDEIRAWFSEKEKYLEKLYHESTLRYSPDEDAIKQLLFNCLEHHFGSLDKVIINPDKYENATKEIRKILDGIGV
jgi:hypothetical protein